MKITRKEFAALSPHEKKKVLSIMARPRRKKHKISFLPFLHAIGGMIMLGRVPR